MASLPATPDTTRSLDFNQQKNDKSNKAKIVGDSECRFGCQTRYKKNHATMTWLIHDVSARDTHGERLKSAEFVVGKGAKQTAWIILCNFGTQNYEDYVSAHVKLVSKAADVCADVELSIVGAYGNKVNTETKTARVFSNSDGNKDGGSNNESTWGYFSFAKRADLRFNPEWVPNDSLTISGRVSVYGDDETLISLDSDCGVGEADIHLESLANDLTSLFVDAQDDDDDIARGSCHSEIVVIRTPGKSFKVHRSVLAARSLVFRRMLDNQPVTTSATTVTATTAEPLPSIHNPDSRGDPSSSTAALPSSSSTAPWRESDSGVISIQDVGDDVTRSTAPWHESGSGVISVPDVGDDVMRSTAPWRESDSGVISIPDVGDAVTRSTAPWRESGSGVISIPDVGDDVMRHFLLYLYGSRVPPEMDEQLAEELLVVADKYDVERLKNACEVALSSSLSESTVPRLLVIADRHRCAKLKEDALSYLTLNPAQIMATPEWRLIEDNHHSIIVDALRALASR